MALRISTALVSLAVAFAFSQGSAAQAGEREVSSMVAKKAAIIDRLHSKASKALVNYAQDKAFMEYFMAPEDQRAAAKAKIDQLSLAVQSKFNVEEMCLIDGHGHEISRIVGNKVAPDGDLSSEEASAPFFEPTFAKAPKSVHISPLYMSPDAAKWVVAYVTPIAGHGGKKEAILHYEHGLDTFQEVIAKGTPASVRVMAVDAAGYIVADSTADIAVAQKGESENPGDYFAKLPPAIAAAVNLGEAGSASVTMKGMAHAVAYKSVEDWTIVAIDTMAGHMNH